MALADWKRAEAAEVIPISASDVEASRQAFDRATLIWFAGGFTTRLMDAIRNTFLPEYLRERWANGVVVGGDSAGGMIVPRVMLMSGPADLTSIAAGRTETTAGIGLLPNLLFDALWTVFTPARGSPLKVRLRLTDQVANQMIVAALAEDYRVGARLPGMQPARRSLGGGGEPGGAGRPAPRRDALHVSRLAEAAKAAGPHDRGPLPSR
jgi:hypothetical protein